MRRKLLASLVAAVVAFPIAALNVPALAATSTQSEAEAEDLALIAEQRGITLEEAQARFGWQEQFVEIANRVEDAHPDQYTAASVNDGSPWIAFKGEVPSGVAELTASLPVAVTLTPGKGYSRTELKAALEDNHYRIMGREDIADATSYYDVQSGNVTIEALPSAKPADPAAFAAQLQAVQPRNTAITVTVKIVSELPGGDEAAYLRGGGMLNNGSVSHCTAAFVVKTSSGTGITTAKHCSDPSTLRYYRHGTSGSNYTNVTRRDSIPYRYGDATWYSRGAYTPSPTFYYNWDVARDVTSVKRPILDQNICRFGRTTGRNCSTPVWVTDVCARDYCDLVATTGHTAENGDSGGPWFWNTTAYGVHKGWKEIADKRRSIFTEAANFPYMDVSVLTR
ncbi:S1 family peptidase [Nonomuraea sp. NPDC046802]|uniref:S1 family peptidase n=1 Tax=Nonomuraea sp. NPDC046802 TaxID=3154919 RepID=UPI0033D64342